MIRTLSVVSSFYLAGFSSCHDFIRSLSFGVSRVRDFSLSKFFLFAFLWISKGVRKQQFKSSMIGSVQCVQSAGTCLLYGRTPNIDQRLFERFNSTHTHTRKKGLKCVSGGSERVRAAFFLWDANTDFDAIIPQTIHAIWPLAGYAIPCNHQNWNVTRLVEFFFSFF